jgi:N-acetyl-gamma-glutamyl-phosphate reductase
MKTAVIGASGYAGGELLRLLAVHPHFQVTAVSAHSNAGELVTSVHPHLTTHTGDKFLAVSEIDFSEIELVFIALPHGESASLVKKIPATAKIVDLGADFRLEDSAQWEKYYGGSHAGAWVYGLPELASGQRAAIAKESRVANPGCYATAITLGIAPAVNHVDVSDVVVVAASGTTGAGRSAKINLIASEVMGSLTSYKFGGVHQHTPEIEQAVSAIAQKNAKISFTPILAPMPRGILATITAKLTKPMNTQEAHDLLTKHYSNEYFVDVLPLGQMPKTGSVTGSNKVQIQVAVDEHTNRLIISVALDNLGKGAASQAIQNANIITGFHEGAGLSTDGLGA